MKKQSDPEWLLDAFDRYFDSIYGYIARRLGPDLAEDIASEVFTVAFENRATFQPGTGSPVGWLFGITHNLLRTHSRKEERRWRAYVRHGPMNEDGQPTIDAVIHLVDTPGQQDRITQALARLNPDQRDVLLLTTWAELTYEQIAES